MIEFSNAARKFRLFRVSLPVKGTSGTRGGVGAGVGVYPFLKNAVRVDCARGGGGTLGISGWGCAAGTLEPLTYTRASSAEFCYPILE